MTHRIEELWREYYHSDNAELSEMVKLLVELKDELEQVKAELVQTLDRCDELQYLVDTQCQTN